MRAFILAFSIGLLACGDASAGIDALTSPQGANGSRERIDDNPIATFDTNGISLKPHKASVCGDGVLDPGEGCDDGNLINGDGCSLDCLVEQYDRDFVLNESAKSTPADPPCSGVHCIMQCVATTNDIVCVNGSAGSITRTAGAGTTTYTDPLGQLALDATTVAKLPTVAGFTALQNAFGGNNTVVYVGRSDSTGQGAGNIYAQWDFRPAAGTAIIDREENDQFTFARYGLTTASGQAGGVFGWTMDAATFNSGTTTLTQWTPAASVTGTLATMTAGTGGVFRVNNDAGGDFGGGSFRSITVYDQDDTTSLAAWANSAYALVADSNSPIVFARSSRGFAAPWATNNRAEPYAPGVPIITSRGIEIHPYSSGDRPAGNGWIADNASTGIPRKGLDASTWATVGTVTVATNQATGYFASFSGNSASFTEMDEIRDATAGTTNKMTLMLTAPSGTVVESPCATWTRARDGAAVTSLTATPEYYTCDFTVTGSPTQVRGEIFVGTASTNGVKGSVDCDDTHAAGSYVLGVVARTGLTGSGSIIVEAPTCSLFTAGIPQPDALSADRDQVSMPAAEVATWRTGEVAGQGFEYEETFTVDADFPGTGGSGFYLFGTGDGSTGETKLLMLETGTGAQNPDGSAHAATDVYVRDGWRSTAYNSTCNGGVFNNTGTDITSVGTLGSFAKGTRLVVRWDIQYAQTLTSVPRVNHAIYLDTCPSGPANACHATTLRASNTSGTMCAGDATDATTYAVLGQRASGSVASSANNPMDGAVAYVAIRQIGP